MFLEGAWDGFPCILNGVVINPLQGLPLRSKQNHVYGNAASQLSASYTRCSEKELRILSRPYIPQPTSSPEVMVLHSQDEAGLSPGRTKECSWASQEAREIGIGTPIASLFKFLMIS